MNEGLDLKIWLTLIGVFVVLFVIPFAVLERDRRRQSRDDTR